MTEVYFKLLLVLKPRLEMNRFKIKTDVQDFWQVHQFNELDSFVKQKISDILSVSSRFDYKCNRITSRAGEDIFKLNPKCQSVPRWWFP
jgi:hypothetical protein